MRNGGVSKADHSKKGSDKMAERRMFSKTIIECDKFIDMPLSSQCLYFHLSMNADDDGFVDSPKKIKRSIGCTDDDLKILVSKGFIIPFESGVVVITHWNVNNSIRGDRKKSTLYTTEKSSLAIGDSGEYCQPSGNQLTTNCQPTDNQMTAQYSIDKVSIDKVNNIGDKKRKRFIPPTLSEVQAYCKERNNTVNAENFVDFYQSKDWYVGKNKMKDWKAAVRTWERNSRQENKQESETDTDLDKYRMLANKF